MPNNFDANFKIVPTMTPEQKEDVRKIYEAEDLSGLTLVQRALIYRQIACEVTNGKQVAKNT
jgi:hypothetical protein